MLQMPGLDASQRDRIRDLHTFPADFPPPSATYRYSFASCPRPPTPVLVYNGNPPARRAPPSRHYLAIAVVLTRLYPYATTSPVLHASPFPASHPCLSFAPIRLRLPFPSLSSPY
ncbi:hypothetical protein B0H19DRAFT_58260 [Mycena capillaripes]|nr:hypothetical protein B0H19DRAFT_58260 [Mycena capillaripes]